MSLRDFAANAAGRRCETTSLCKAKRAGSGKFQAGLDGNRGGLAFFQQVIEKAQGFGGGLERGYFNRRCICLADHGREQGYGQLVTTNLERGCRVLPVQGRHRKECLAGFPQPRFKIRRLGRGGNLDRRITPHIDIGSSMRALPLRLSEAPDDVAGIARALGDIARAKGMSQVARETGLSRESLYKALSENGNPSLATVLKVAKALGLTLHANAA